MGRKARRQIQTTETTASPKSPWAIVLTAAIAAAIAGAAIGRATAPHPVSKPAAAVASVAAPSPPAAPSPTPTAVPPPNIVLDLPPAKVALNLGNFSYDQQNWPAAIAYYTEAVRRGIDSADVLTDLGNSCRFNGDYKNALVDYQSAQQRDPHHENSLFNQGAVYGLLGQPDKAVAVWQDYLKRFPNGKHVADARDLISSTAHTGLTAPALPQ